MSDKTTITRDEWLAAIGGHPEFEEDPTSITMKEFSAMLNVHDAKARKLMAKLVAEGKAKMVTKACKLSDGQIRRLPAYRLIKQDGA